MDWFTPLCLREDFFRFFCRCPWLSRLYRNVTIKTARSSGFACKTQKSLSSGWWLRCTLRFLGNVRYSSSGEAMGSSSGVADGSSLSGIISGGEETEDELSTFGPVGTAGLVWGSAVITGANVTGTTVSTSVGISVCKVAVDGMLVITVGAIVEGLTSVSVGGISWGTPVVSGIETGSSRSSSFCAGPLKSGCPAGGCSAGHTVRSGESPAGKSLGIFSSICRPLGAI